MGWCRMADLRCLVVFCSQSVFLVSLSSLRVEREYFAFPCRYSCKMAPAMKSMKSAAMKGSSLTQSAVYSSVAETVGLKPKQVKGVVEGIMGVASEQLKKNGAFKFAGMLNMKLKKKPATPARKG